MTRPSAGRRGGEGSLDWVKALALIGVLVIIGWAILARTGKAGGTATAAGGHHAPTTTSTTTPTTVPTPSTTLLPPAQVKVLVLNGADPTKPLAGEWSAKLHSNPGFTTLPPDNATSTVPASIIYVVTPGYLPEAQLLAQSVGLTSTSISTTLPTNAPVKAADRSTANLILVVGPDLQGSA